MSGLPQLKITCPSGVGRASQVELDGEPIATMLHGVDLHLDDSGAYAIAKLDLVVGAEFDGKVHILLSEEAKTLLKRLGWTPPDEATGGDA